MGRPGKYDAATRGRGVRMYYERLEEGGTSTNGARREIGELLDVNDSTLRNWIRAHDKPEDAPADAKMSYAEPRSLPRVFTDHHGVSSLCPSCTSLRRCEHGPWGLTLR